MASELELEVCTWDQIYNLLLDIGRKIRKSRFKPDLIVGVSRGGWTPARVISDLLENPSLANIKTEFYLRVAETKAKPVITQPVSVPVEGKKVLVVDDIADTGESLHLVQTHLKELGATEVRIATVYYKPWSVLKPDWYEKQTSSWVVFPWERKETVRSIIDQYKCRGKTIEEAKEKLVKAGLSRELAQQFIQEVSEEDI